MTDHARAEFLVEPFEEGTPGPHVIAAIEACRSCGLEPAFGPFGSIISGAAPVVSAAIAAATSAALEAGASRIHVQIEQGEQPGNTQLDNLHGALERLIASVEHELKAPLADLDREQKQVAVRRLAENGAFLLRKSVEEVADQMGVSRMSIYNYLNTIADPAVGTDLETDAS